MERRKGQPFMQSYPAIPLEMSYSPTLSGFPVDSSVSYVVRCTNEMLSSDVSSFSGFSSSSGLWLHDWPGVFRPGLVTLPHGVGPARKGNYVVRCRFLE